MENQHEPELTAEQKDQLEQQRLHIEKVKVAIKEIEKIMEENNLTLHVEHMIRFVPRR